ncbi:hypothetical protein NAEGRDRAFT_79116 [Naegleria gruberi]|uniref:Pre-mRNA splicing factor n=1 Tax=Naegleria gruberi TaxID=5762 RepID=D2V945_NAEGR|nr:uncharacterized protein NAEGRDRAFT_79116 [Naegleria gruberi]EFC46525.1 hypothetical protein NAEGRDRAFT_79116 [Naegleria gruberi]|eukprot:XP_002679269.1 hypothetical protein NAEGRDRAFT_79116 [Naegleria gruberi strain NEG-M]
MQTLSMPSTPTKPLHSVAQQQIAGMPSFCGSEQNNGAGTHPHHNLFMMNDYRQENNPHGPNTHGPPRLPANSNHIWDQCYSLPTNPQMSSFIPSNIMDDLCLSPTKVSASSGYSPFGGASKSIFNGKTESFHHTARKLDFDNVPSTHSSLFSSPTSQVAASSIQQQVRQNANSYELFTDNGKGSFVKPSIEYNQTQLFNKSVPNSYHTNYHPQSQPTWNNFQMAASAQPIQMYSNTGVQYRPYPIQPPFLENGGQNPHFPSKIPYAQPMPICGYQAIGTDVMSLTNSFHQCTLSDNELMPPPPPVFSKPGNQSKLRRSSCNSNSSCGLLLTEDENLNNPTIHHARASSSGSVELDGSNWHEPFEKAMQTNNLHPNGYSSVPNSPSRHKRNGSSGSNNASNVATLSINTNLVTNSSNDSSTPTSPSKKESVDDKQAFKDVQLLLKSNEKIGYESCRKILINHLYDPKCKLGSHMHWRVHMDLADLAKRENLLNDARKEFSMVNRMQPTASQGWLEHAKLEEESGNYEKCGKLLIEGLDKCRNNESLLVKAIKHFEQVDDLNTARSILGKLKGQKPETCWKILLEGALLESRANNVDVARKVFKYLMKNVPRHGPIYYEAFKLEEKCEQFEQALNIVEQGLIANPRYGPLWFAALRLYERKYDKAYDIETKESCLNDVRQCIARAAKNISKELKWKVYFELAQFEERATNLQLARKAYSKSAVKALENLRWKVWLAGSRTELNAGNIEISRMLLNRALQEVPAKTKAVVLIECARLEEFCNNLEKAREFLNRAKYEAKHEWKVFLESILLEMRAGDTDKATNEAKEALEIHRGTGRLWAVLIQLKHMKGDIAECYQVFKEALEEVPKSGEVWCEGARIALNPLSPKFSLEKAKRYLNFAIKFTPQYGDSFIEYLRLELLTRGPSVPSSAAAPTSSSVTNSTVAIQEYIENMCVNADPNYGPLWFHCKTHPLDSTKQVLRRAKDMLMAELVQQKEIYQRAIMNRHCKKSKKPSYNTCRSSDIKKFITGLCALNLMYNNHNLSFEMRKKYIYLNEISV